MEKNLKTEISSLPRSRKVRITKPYPITYRFKAKSEFEGKTVLELMCTRFPFYGREVWQKKIADGFIGVNDEKVSSDYILSGEDEIFHHNPNVKEPSVPDEAEILVERDDYLIVYKPAPMPMHPGGRYNKNSLTHLLEELGYQNLRVVHRLDAVTSGIVLFAKNKEFAKQAMLCFSSNRVKKTYYALVAGVPQESSITINAPIGRKSGFVFECLTDGQKVASAKKAITHFEVMRRGKECSIVKCTPETGRTHQIRLHLEKWGYPIVDDPIYGPNGDKSSKKTQNIGICLLNAGLIIDDLGVKWELKAPETWDEKIAVSQSA